MFICLEDIDWVSVLTSIGTLVVAIGTILMVLEIKKQRESSYRPQIVFEKAIFSVQGWQKDGISMPTKWNDIFTKDNLYIQLKDSEFNENKYYLKMTNIGLASAKNIQINLSYDLDGFVEKIKNLESRIPKELLLGISFLKDWIHFENQGSKVPYRGFTSYRGDELENYISSILPVNITKDFYPVRLPVIFLELINIYIFYLSNLLGKDKPFPSVPVVTININYENIADVKMFQKYFLNTTFHSWGGGIFFGEFLIRK